MRWRTIKEHRKQKIFSLWLAGNTTEETAALTGVSKSEVDRTFSQYGDIAELGKTQQNAANHESDFEPPIYNIWKQQVSLADAIDDALGSGEATKPFNGRFQVGTYEIAPAEVDRWRKLRAIPEGERADPLLHSTPEVR